MNEKQVQKFTGDYELRPNFSIAIAHIPAMKFWLQRFSYARLFRYKYKPIAYS